MLGAQRRQPLGPGVRRRSGWHHGIPCDPARHRGLQRLLAAQDTGADQAA